MRPFCFFCLFLALTINAACTGFTDVSSLEPEEEACTINVDTACPAGTAKKAFSDLATYGVCDTGTESRYLRDLSQATVGYCNGVSSACGYICIKDETQVVCEGNGTCSPGFNPVSAENLAGELARVTAGKAPVSNQSCQDGKIIDDAGAPVASCQVKSGCTYYCVREFVFECECGADEFGVCSPCDTCSATSLVCSDGSCVEIDTLRAGICAQNPDPNAPCTEEMNQTIACVWSQSTPPVTCSEEGLSQFIPNADALNNCVPSEHLFTCNDGQQTIPDYRYCDHNPDCNDQSDEANCVVVGDQFSCFDGQKTIPWDQYCDDNQDCNDNSDESDCAVGDLFECGDGQTIPMFQLCDQNPDCNNQADEAAATCGIDPTDCHPRDNHLPCKVGGLTTCLEVDVLCDLNNDCDNGEDESNAFCTPEHEGRFYCGDGNSVDITTICEADADITNDCSDGRDETSPLCNLVNGF